MFLPYLAPLIRPEEDIEGTACNRHVRGVVFAEPGTWEFPSYSFVDALVHNGVFILQQMRTQHL